MALSTEERERIREEEWVRVQAREDFKRGATPNSPAPSIAGFAGMFVLILGLLAIMGILVRFFGGSGF